MTVRTIDRITQKGLLVDNDGHRLTAIQSALRANDKYGHAIGKLTRQLLDLVRDNLRKVDKFTVEFANGQEFSFVLQDSKLDRILQQKGK